MVTRLVIWFIGMVAFSCTDAAIVIFANTVMQPFSLLWWCFALMGGVSMCVSLYCKAAFISTLKRIQRKYSAKHIAIAIIGNVLLMVVVAKGV